MKPKNSGHKALPCQNGAAGKLAFGDVGAL